MRLWTRTGTGLRELEHLYLTTGKYSPPLGTSTEYAKTRPETSGPPGEPETYFLFSWRARMCPEGSRKRRPKGPGRPSPPSPPCSSPPPSSEGEGVPETRTCTVPSTERLDSLDPLYSHVRSSLSATETPIRAGGGDGGPSTPPTPPSSAGRRGEAGGTPANSSPSSSSSPAVSVATDAAELSATDPAGSSATGDAGGAGRDPSPSADLVGRGERVSTAEALSAEPTDDGVSTDGAEAADLGVSPTRSPSSVPTGSYVSSCR
mmetsp:Transcript_25916/g.58125  ORF Transcript_25916/g.58125 Transcript_25916/m.58125 type:complete len:262 (+) Transcript_25916:534-1319(+)